jgi:LacI family transcriptional regulator
MSTGGLQQRVPNPCWEPDANARRLCIVRGMPVKMKDIARDLGVSVVTISKALRGHPDISTATRERILLKAKELGYRPNLTARSLVTGRSSLIGLIVPDLIHPFFADIAKSLSMAMRRQGYFLVLSSSEEDPDLEREEIEHMLAHRLDALIVATCQPGPESLRNIQQGETPLILLDRSFKEMRSHFVGSDDYTAGKLATEHLLAIGCKRVAHIRGPENSVGQRRLKGFLDTLKKRAIEMPAEYLIQAPRADVDGHQNGITALRRLLGLNRPPDGIFCYNDIVAMGVIAEALRQEIAVPKELAVIGCGNLHYVSEIRVPLSSVDQRSGEIGQRAARLILDILAAEAIKAPLEYREIILQPRLTVRDSTARTSQAESQRASSARGRSSRATISS